jgi:hypothetical protein
VEANSTFALADQTLTSDLTFFIVTGLALLTTFLLLGFHQGDAAADESALKAVDHILNLEGAPFAYGQRLLDDSDYRLLKSDPNLKEVAASLRKERRTLVLMWIDSISNDVETLWRFRRFIINQHQAPVKASEEWAIFRSFVVTIGVLNVMRLSVLVLGPFAFSGWSRLAGKPIVSLSNAAANLLARVPSSGWSEIERAWINTSS